MKKIIIMVATLTFLASCNNNDKKNVTAQSIKKATIDSMDYANKQQRMIDSLQALTQGSSKNLEMESPAMIPIEEGHKKTTPRKKVASVKHTPAVNTPQTTNATPAQPQSGSVGNTTPVPANNSTVAAVPEKKKGLNNAAKGAIIGLGTGAAAGAIIGKENRGKGAIIGGVAGAIGGAVGGAILDRHKVKKAADRDSIRRDSIRNNK